MVLVTRKESFTALGRTTTRGWKPVHRNQPTSSKGREVGKEGRGTEERRNVVKGGLFKLEEQ